MSKIKGIYAASMSIFNKNLSLNIEKTLAHAEKIIEQGCHGAVIFGSTGQAQLIPVNEKIALLNKLSKSRHKDKFLVGTGFNSLVENINLMKVAISLNLNKFLIMPPAYYKYGDKEVIQFYTRIVEAVPSSKIILYNFEKLCGYKFSLNCVEELVKKFPDQIVGVKDSSYNLFENLKIENFSVLPGSETKLLKGLELGCTINEKLCKVRSVFDKFNLISGLHSFMSDEDEIYKNILPPISLLDEMDKNQLIKNLNEVDFNLRSLRVV